MHAFLPTDAQTNLATICPAVKATLTATFPHPDDAAINAAIKNTYSAAFQTAF
jgi:hypothetical protein